MQYEVFQKIQVNYIKPGCYYLVDVFVAGHKKCLIIFLTLPGHKLYMSCDIMAKYVIVAYFSIMA